MPYAKKKGHGKNCKEPLHEEQSKKTGSSAEETELAPEKKGLPQEERGKVLEKARGCGFERRGPTPSHSKKKKGKSFGSNPSGGRKRKMFLPKTRGKGPCAVEKPAPKQQQEKATKRRGGNQNPRPDGEKPQNQKTEETASIASGGGKWEH